MSALFSRFFNSVYFLKFPKFVQQTKAPNFLALAAMKISSISSLFSRFTSDNSVHHCEGRCSDLPSNLSFPSIDFSMTAAALPNTVRTIRLNTNETFRMTGKLVGNLGNIFIETMDGAPLYVMRPSRDYSNKQVLSIHDTTSGIVYRVQKRQNLIDRIMKKAVVSVQDGWEDELQIFEVYRLKTNGGFRLSRMADGVTVGRVSRQKVSRLSIAARKQRETIGTVGPYTNPLLTIMIVTGLEALLK